jgi:hypothetical protein
MAPFLFPTATPGGNGGFHPKAPENLHIYKYIYFFIYFRVLQIRVRVHVSIQRTYVSTR